MSTGSLSTSHTNLRQTGPQRHFVLLSSSEHSEQSGCESLDSEADTEVVEESIEQPAYGSTKTSNRLISWS